MSNDQKPLTRGDLLIVDFGTPVGHEQGFVRPAVIVSGAPFSPSAEIHGTVIVVPGTSVPQLSANGQPHTTVIEVAKTDENKLFSPTYFLPRQVRCISTLRIHRKIGRLDAFVLKELNNLLRRVMRLMDGMPPR